MISLLVCQKNLRNNCNKERSECYENNSFMIVAKYCSIAIYFNTNVLF